MPAKNTITSLNKETVITIQGQVADALLSAVETQKPAIVAAIQQGEGNLEQFLETAVDGIKPPNGILAVVWPMLKPSIISELKTLEAQEPGSVIYALIDTEARTLAKSLGG